MTASTKTHVRLKLHRVIEDAWDDGLRAWCEAASQAALAGNHCWLVVAARGQVRWIKQRALRERMTLFGLKFLEPQMLRRVLCAWLGVEEKSLGRETLELLLKTAAARHGDADSRAVTRDAGACLRAMDELAAAGWSEAELDVPATAAREFFRALREARAWTPEIDRRLIQNAAPRPLLSCVVGWDAGNFGDLNLLEALSGSSARCELFLPQPRATAEAVQLRWIEAVEARLGASKTTCGESEFFSPHDALISRLEGSDLAVESTSPPRLLVGRDWSDQIRLVRDEAIEWLAGARDGDRLGIIVPGRSPTSLALVRALAGAGLSLLDETGEKGEAAPAILLQAQIVRYHLRGCDVESLAALIALLNAPPVAAWNWLDPEEVHALLNQAFGTMQSRNARMLARGFNGRENKVWKQIAWLIDVLGKWEEARSWIKWRAGWEAALAPLGLTTDLLEPLWSRVGDALGERKISARLFLEYMDAMLAGRRSRRAPEAASAHARVVVTTFAGARQQSWDRLVFLEANEGVWPMKPEENPFLDDAARTALNGRGGRGHLLTTSELSAIEQARFLDLLEHCAGEIVLAATARESGDAGRDAYPNEWVIRCLIESHRGDAKAALAQWKNAIAVCTENVSGLPDTERSHLENVHGSRRNPTMPFDRYLFDFHETAFVPQAWSAGRLDEVISCPATFALREIFGAESLRTAAWTRGEGMVVGTLAHRWLARALEGGEEFKPLPREGFWARLDTQVAATRARLREGYAGENLELPIWWETCLRKAAWVARRCLAPLGKLEGAWFFAMEKRLRETVKTGDGPLRLKGRFDLVLSDRRSLDGARVIVIDFKTGKSAAPSLATLGHGSGFQFAAYFLMAKDGGAASVSAGIIRHDLTKLDAFAEADETSLRALMSPIARLQRELVFGRCGPLVAQFGRCEILPMATLALDARVLARKAELGLLAAR